MSKILFITGDYYPFFSPNGSVIKNIIDELKEEHEVLVLSTKNRFGLDRRICLDGYQINRVNNYYSMIHNYFQLKTFNSQKKSVKLFFHFLLQCKRIMYFLYKTLGKNSLNKKMINDQIKEIKKLHKEFQFDIIIPISMPIESIASAIKYKLDHNPLINVIPYQIDHFADSPTLHGHSILRKIKFKEHLKLEETFIKNSYHYFIFPQIYSHIKKYKQLNDNIFKIEVTEHPLLTDKTNSYVDNSGFFKDDKVNLLFSGMLNKKSRNPKSLLDILSLLKKESEFRINIFHVGDCNSLINSYKKLMGDNLKNYGQVSLNKSFEGMNNADVLISLGVTSGNQVSGKIFDYFSFGKPIIHLYYFDEDPNLKYLERYPLSLSIKIDSNKVQENAFKIEQFLKENTGKKIEYKIVEKIFEDATPKYVAKKFINIIKKIEEEAYL